MRFTRAAKFKQALLLVRRVYKDLRRGHRCDEKPCRFCWGSWAEAWAAARQRGLV